MLKSYVQTAWRYAIRHQFISILNICGLALGLAASLFIFLWIGDERSIDQFHTNGRFLYAVYEREFYNNKVTADYETSALLPEEIKRVIPEVQMSTGMEEYVDHSTFQFGDKRLKWNGDAGSADFFYMFTYPLLAGNPSSALVSPDGIALSRKMANAFFGSPQAAMGKTIRYENKRDFKVTAVFEDLPLQSSRKFDFLLNWRAFLAETSLSNWEAAGPYTIIQLRPDADPKLVDRKITHFLDVYRKNQPAGYRIELHLQKYGDIYLHNHFTNGKPDSGRIEYIGSFFIVAVFILVIACINFMNLATARSLARAKEIGVRKVIGASRFSLIRQILTESFFLTVASVVVAVLLLALLLPEFNILTEKQIDLPFNRFSFWIMLFLLTTAAGLLSGSYPALFLSAFKPLAVFKRGIYSGAKHHWLRTGLVVFQFTLSITMIIGAIVVSRQLDFIQTRDIGYDKENLIYIPMEGALVKQYDYLKDQATKTQAIESISFISDDPDYLDDNTTDISWEGKEPNRLLEAAQAEVTPGFVQTMKLSLIGGRDFSNNYPSDTASFLINETAAREIGYRNPIGRTLTMWGRKGRIIGVLKDFNFKPVRERIIPLVLFTFFHPRPYGTILVRTRAGKTRQALSILQSLCRQTNPGFPFTYQFSAESYLRSYQNEQVVRNLADIFSLLATIVSCLGLFGLASFTTEQRTKEIGIRKVLGASTQTLFLLVSREFLLLVGIALMIAAPLAWYLMTGWLGNYAYRTSLAWWIFPFAGGIAFFITVLTVGFQSAKVAIVNPVKCLRSE